MILTKGFKDLLEIRHQSRPNIFDLSCHKEPPLYTKVFEVDERVYLGDVNNKNLEVVQK